MSTTLGTAVAAAAAAVAAAATVSAYATLPLASLAEWPHINYFCRPTEQAFALSISLSVQLSDWLTCMHTHTHAHIHRCVLHTLALVLVTPEHHAARWFYRRLFNFAVSWESDSAKQFGLSDKYI